MRRGSRGGGRGRGGRRLFNDGWMRKQNLSMSSTIDKNNYGPFKCVTGGTSITQNRVGEWW